MRTHKHTQHHTRTQPLKRRSGPKPGGVATQWGNRQHVALAYLHPSNPPELRASEKKQNQPLVAQLLNHNQPLRALQQSVLGGIAVVLQHGHRDGNDEQTTDHSLRHAPGLLDLLRCPRGGTLGQRCLL